MSKLLTNQISNYNDNGPVEVKDGINVASGKPLQVAGANGTSGDYLKSTGSSVAWTTFPSIPAAQVNADWNATSGVEQILNKPTLAAVATSGQYGDLSGLPTIPAAQVQSDWNTSNTSSVSFIQNKPTLFSGAYNDLTGKPTIPTNLSDLSDVSSTAPNNNEVLKWNGSNWAPATDASGGGGVTTFTALTDTPANFTSQAGKYLKVNAGATALEFVTLPVDPDTNTNDYVSSASLSGNTLTLGRTGSQSLADLTVDLSSLGGGATVTTDDSAPGSPNDGDLWWKSDEGRLKIYYADGSSDQWVDASPVLSPTSMTSGSNSIAVTSTRSTVTGPLRVTGTLTGQTTGNKITYASHFIPDTNAAYDLGNAEYKVRHLFLSDNTLYYEGDFLKVAQHNSGGSAQSASYLIPLAKLKDALNASADYEAFKTAILAITDA